MRQAVLIPCDLAGDMPFRVMEQLKNIVVKRAGGQSITWRGFSYSPSYWIVYFELGDNKSTFSEIIRKVLLIRPTPDRDPIDKMNRFELTTKEKHFGININRN